MNQIELRRTFPILATALGLLSVTAYPANAVITVYEGFQYDGLNDSLHGQPNDPGGTDTDATGLGGTWSDTTGATNNMFIKSGSLAFGDLPTTGNSIGYLSNQQNDIFTRPLTGGATTSISGSNEIWFSILFEKLQNNFSAGEGGFAFSNQTVGNSRIFLNDGTDGLAGFGFGPTTSGSDLTPYAWDGSSLITGDAVISVPPNNGSTNTAGLNLGPVHLIVGQISFDTGSGGTDEYTLYDYQLSGGSVAGGTLSPIASTIEINVDQTTSQMLDTINLTRQVNVNYDELRIGTTLDDVLGAQIPEPSSIMLLGLAGLGFLRRRR